MSFKLKFTGMFGKSRSRRRISILRETTNGEIWKSKLNGKCGFYFSFNWKKKSFRNTGFKLTDEG